MLESFGLAPTYMFYGVCCAMSFFVVKKFLPETANRELEDMQYQATVK